MQDPHGNLSLAPAIAVKAQARAKAWLTMTMARSCVCSKVSTILNACDFQAFSSKFQGPLQAVANFSFVNKGIQNNAHIYTHI